MLLFLFSIFEILLEPNRLVYTDLSPQTAVGRLALDILPISPGSTSIAVTLTNKSPEFMTCFELSDDCVEVVFPSGAFVDVRHSWFKNGQIRPDMAQFVAPGGKISANLEADSFDFQVRLMVHARPGLYLCRLHYSTGYLNFWAAESKYRQATPAEAESKEFWLRVEPEKLLFYASE